MAETYVKSEFNHGITTI